MGARHGPAWLARRTSHISGFGVATLMHREMRNL
jgi:hypothetical protein